MPAFKLATTGQFDLKCPQYYDPAWWASFQLAMEKVMRDMAYEVSQVNLISSVASGIGLVIESIRNPATTDAAAKEFASRWKIWSNILSSSQDMGISSISGKVRSNTKTSLEEKELDKADKAKQAWEKIFGKRGDPRTEAKIVQTQKMFQGMIQEAQEARAKPKRQKTRRRQR